MSTLGLILVLVLSVCHSVSGWMFHYPLTAREGQKQLQFTITADDNVGPDPPYIFQVWKNVTGKPNEQVQLQYVNTSTTTTQFYWDNDQPAGTVLMFQLTDNTGRPARSPLVEVSPNLVVSASIISTMSTASVGSVMATQTSSSLATSTQSASSSSPSTSSPTPSPVKISGGAIAGGVVGGVLIVAAIVAALVLCLRRRRPQQTPNMLDLNTGGTSVTPFLYDNPYQAHSPRPQPYDPVSHPVQVMGPRPVAEEAPPVYSPRSPLSATSYTESSSYTYNSQASGSTFRVASGPPRTSDRKGTYARVSSTPH